MTITAGVLSQVSVQPNSVQLAATATTGGTAPYTYQWYRSTTTGFSPGGGNILTGKTSLTLTDTTVTPNTNYFYKVVATDAASATATYTQLAVTSAAIGLYPNSFGQNLIAGVVDLRVAHGTISAMIDVSQTGNLYPGCAVKMVDSAGGVPKVVACTANTDGVLGFINYDIKTPAFTAGMPCELSIAGNAIYLYSTTAIPRGAAVTLDVATQGGVGVLVGSSGANLVGWAFDKAPAAGALIRVYVKTPSFIAA